MYNQERQSLNSVPTGSFSRSVKAVGASFHKGKSFIHRQILSVRGRLQVACGIILSMYAAAGFPSKRDVNSTQSYRLSSLYITNNFVLLQTEVPMCHKGTKGLKGFSPLPQHPSSSYSQAFKYEM